MKIRTLCLVSIAGLAGSAAAQDSAAVPFANDAINSFESIDGQRTAFVVDMARFTSSNGKSYGIAPIAKTGRNVDGSDFNNALNGGHAISRLATNGLLFGNGFSLWENNPSAGVNPPFNTVDGVSTVQAPGNTTGFTYSFSAFNDFGDENIGGQISFDPANPERLYVNRIVAATGNDNNANLGSGQVDAAGFTLLRVDSFFSEGTNPVSGVLALRTDLTARTDVINSITGSGIGQPAATEIVDTNSDTVQIGVPAAVPAGVGGNGGLAPSIMTTNFDSELRFNDLTQATMDHLGDAPDQRGTIAVLPEAFYGQNNAITAAVLTKDTSSANQTSAISVWGASATGQVTNGGTRYLSPATVTDPITGIDIFRREFVPTGGSGFFSNNPPISLARDADGNLLIAGVVETDFFPSTVAADASEVSQFQAVIVGRISADNPGEAEWSVASYIDLTFVPGSGTTRGKPFADENGVVIAEIATAQDDTGDATGPSQTPVSFDSAGNIYFVSPVRFYGEDGLPLTDDDLVSNTIVRANYISDLGVDSDLNGANDFGYELESLVSTGETYTSPATGLDYTIFGFRIRNNAGGASNGGFFHNNVTSVPSQIEDLEDNALGGLVYMANFAYDVNQNGTTLIDGEPDPEDQTYRALFYVQPLPAGEVTPDRLCADQNNDGAIAADDFSAFLTNFLSSNPIADVNGDGVIAADDFNFWLTSFFAGQFGPICNP
ncbi:MAG: EF-hand domain-containing protein [Planctomycetota bacterium]